MARIIKKNTDFRAAYHSIGRGDLILGQLNLKQCEEYVFLDLMTRGVEMLPHALAQMLSRSKCMQATVYAPYMLPHTKVIRCRSDLVKALQEYAEAGIGQVISKRDRGDCGTGINIWHSAEDVYNAVSVNPVFFPFVLQPFLDNAVDVRVIVIGDYVESYWRKNPCSFRNNLHFGGETGVYMLESGQRALCRQVMDRGRFPFAHIDLLVDGGDTWFGEISLRGGIKGASITAADYRIKIEEIYHAAEREFIQRPAE